MSLNNMTSQSPQLIKPTKSTTQLTKSALPSHSTPPYHLSQVCLFDLSFTQAPHFGSIAVGAQLQYASVLLPTFQQVVKALKAPPASNSTTLAILAITISLATPTLPTDTTPQSQPSVIFLEVLITQSDAYKQQPKNLINY